MDEYNSVKDLPPVKSTAASVAPGDNIDTIPANGAIESKSVLTVFVSVCILHSVAILYPTLLLVNR